jgi:hypothetical protein
MKISDRNLTLCAIRMLNSATTFIADLLDDEVEAMCLEQAVNISRLAILANTRDRLRDSARATALLIGSQDS